MPSRDEGSFVADRPRRPLVVWLLARLIVAAVVLLAVAAMWLVGALLDLLSGPLVDPTIPHF